MTTTADRLLQLAGTTGTAAALLLAIGTGATAGEVLVEYSGLPSATAAEHLLADAVQPAPTYVLGLRPQKPTRDRRRHAQQALMFVIH